MNKIFFEHNVGQIFQQLGITRNFSGGGGYKLIDIYSGVILEGLHTRDGNRNQKNPYPLVFQRIGVFRKLFLLCLEIISNTNSTGSVVTC